MSKIIYVVKKKLSDDGMNRTSKSRIIGRNRTKRMKERKKRKKNSKKDEHAISKSFEGLEDCRGKPPKKKDLLECARRFTAYVPTSQGMQEHRRWR